MSATRHLIERWDYRFGDADLQDALDDAKPITRGKARKLLGRNRFTDRNRFLLSRRYRAVFVVAKNGTIVTVISIDDDIRQSAKAKIRRYKQQKPRR